MTKCRHDQVVGLFDPGFAVVFLPGLGQLTLDVIQGVRHGSIVCFNDASIRAPWNAVVPANSCLLVEAKFVIVSLLVGP